MSGEYGIGYTSKGEEFWFDLEDYEKIKNYFWYIDRKGYVVSGTDKSNFVRLHRLILDIVDRKIQVDHIKHKKFDNRKSELRIANNGQNQMNKNVQKNASSGYKGVRFQNGRWSARIHYNKKQIFLGYFDNIEDAIKARKEAEEKYFGEYSYDNSMSKQDEPSYN